jgi:hypothetical protein
MLVHMMVVFGAHAFGQAMRTDSGSFQYESHVFLYLRLPT